VARNGLEAWELAQVQQFDIVLTDQQMPELNGTELCGRLRGLSHYADVPIILLSAKGLEMDAQQLRDTLGIVAVLPKPFSPSALIEVVESTLSSTA
jgi:CheY-like chemotaxis protein